ncbi:hypothetical protein D3C83_189350 [compost metagenome]
MVDYRLVVVAYSVEEQLQLEEERLEQSVRAVVDLSLVWEPEAPIMPAQELRKAEQSH